MLNRIRRAYARWHWTRQERHWRAEVARLMLVQETLADDMDTALRNVSACAMNRTMTTILRPPISHAPGRGPSDGVQRFSLVRSGQTPKQPSPGPRHLNYPSLMKRERA